jgi:hypothetical protein
MMRDTDTMAASPFARRTLSQAGLLGKWIGKPSKNGTDLTQPLAAHPRNPLV